MDEMMSNQRPLFEDPEDGIEVNQEQLAALQVKAQELGLHINSRDPIEIEALIALASAERGAEHPVPCFGLSYDPTDRRCRICQLRSKCSALDESPRVEVADLTQLQPVVCEACGGSLEVELLDRESREIRDYGCTSHGCMNTLGVQCGWETHGADVVRDIILPKDQEKAQAEPEEEVPFPPSAAEPPAPRKPSKKKTAKKKTAKKKTAKKAKVRIKPSKKTKKVVDKPADKPKAGALVFIYDNEAHATLTPIAVKISGSRNWSGKKFFKLKGDLGDLEPGTVLEREWDGQVHTVTVRVDSPLEE